MAVSGLRFENALVGYEWATAVLLCTNWLRKQSSCPMLSAPEGCIATAWLSLGSALKMPRLALSGPLLSSYAQTGCENSPLALHGTHFRRGSIYPDLGERLPAECRDYCQLVNGWVWFESRTLTWL